MDLKTFQIILHANAVVEEVNELLVCRIQEAGQKNKLSNAEQAAMHFEVIASLLFVLSEAMAEVGDMKKKELQEMLMKHFNQKMDLLFEAANHLIPDDNTTETTSSMIH
jgi:hypothetical protein